MIGHLNNAPEELVPGCLFWPNGAPTRILEKIFDVKIARFQLLAFQIIVIWTTLAIIRKNKTPVSHKTVKKLYIVLTTTQ